MSGIMLIGISKTQAPLDSLMTRKNLRLAVVVKYRDSFLLVRNKSLGYNDITTFLNTGLCSYGEKDYAVSELIPFAKELVRHRTGYVDIEYQYLLTEYVEWNFHKPDKEYNECGIYHNTILVFTLLSLGRSLIGIDEQYESIRYTEKELEDKFRTDGSNGSSHLLYQVYRNNCNNIYI